MSVEEVAEGLYRIPLGTVNAYLLVDGEELLLIDTGVPGSADKILAAVRGLGRDPSAIRRIVATHLHADHTGSLASLRKRTGASTYAHPQDAQAIRQGRSLRPVQPSDTWLGRILYLVLQIMPNPDVEPAAVEHEVGEGDRLELSEGTLEVLHTPGHSAGQIALFWSAHGGVLIAADAASNMLGLGPPPIYEDPAAGEQTLKRLAALEFEVAVFGHGKPIRADAARRFRERFG